MVSSNDSPGMCPGSPVTTSRKSHVDAHASVCHTVPEGGYSRRAFSLPNPDFLQKYSRPLQLPYTALKVNDPNSLITFILGNVREM